jgi:hypothetical protein
LEELLGAVTNVKIHIFIQLFSQVFTPIFVKILSVFLWMIGVYEWILKGLVSGTSRRFIYTSVLSNRYWRLLHLGLCWCFLP